MYVPAGIAPGVGIDAVGAKDARGLSHLTGGGADVGLGAGALAEVAGALGICVVA